MHIHEYQTWLKSWDEQRGWDRVLLSHTMLHAMEELGEVSKLVQIIEGYRNLPDEGLAHVRDLLALELSDLQVMLFKIAYIADIDMETALRRGMEKADKRFPDPSAGQDELQAAWKRFAQYLERNALTPLLPNGDPHP